MGLFPRAIKEENKMAFGLNLYSLMGFLITMMISVNFGSNFVHSYFKVPFFIFCIVLYFVLNVKSPNNPKRKIWQGMIIWLISLRLPKNYISVIGYAFKEAANEK